MKIEILISLFNNVFTKITELNYERIYLEVVYDESIFFSAKFKNNITLHMEIHLDNLESCFYTLYKYKQMLANGYGTINNVMADIKMKLGKLI